MTTIPIHLLSLAAMHTEGPGSLDVVFGPDGDFEGAPCTVLQVFDVARNEYMPRTWPDIEQMIDGGGIPARYALDCRLPSVVARLVVVMWPLSNTLSGGDLVFLANAARPDSRWDSVRAARLAALTLALAPQIAALGASR